MNKTKQLIANKLFEADIIGDRLIFSKDGTITFKRGYFYTMGKSSREYADQIKAVFPNARIISAEDSYKRWPGQSYFIVKFRLEEKRNFFGVTGGSYSPKGF